MMTTVHEDRHSDPAAAYYPSGVDAMHPLQSDELAKKMYDIW